MKRDRKRGGDGRPENALPYVRQFKARARLNGHIDRLAADTLNEAYRREQYNSRLPYARGK